MRLTIIILLLFSTFAFADEKPPVPFHLQVPDPIPPNFNECVVVTWNDEERAINDSNGGFLKPPLTPQQIEALRTIRREKMGTIQLCDMDDA